jgi:hypothetical protein
MSVRRQIIAALSEDSYGGIATLHDVAHAEQLVDAYKAEMLAEAADYFEQRRPSRADAVSDFDRGRRATVGWVVEELRDQAGAGEKASAQAPTATPTDTNRRARLLHEITFDGGRWKSGDVARWYQTQGLTGLDVRAARHDLATLRDSGAITQHDTAGVRFYTRASHTTRKDRT